MRNENPWQTCVVNVHFVGCTQPGPKELAYVSKPNPKDTSKRQRIESEQPALFIPNQKTTRDPYKRIKPLRIN